MGVYSGGRGISHYPLASISRIFWQLTLIYKQYAMENGLMARYVVLLKKSSMLRGLHVYSFKLPSVLNHLRRLPHWR